MLALTRTPVRRESDPGSASKSPAQRNWPVFIPAAIAEGAR